MKVQTAAIQLPSEPLAVAANLERAEAQLRRAHLEGVELAVLPELFNTGYGLVPSFDQVAEGSDGPTLRLLRDRSRRWRMAIAAGFIEREGRHLYDSLAFCMPDGRLQIYRKRNLVFWERFRFRPGREPLIVATPWGRIGFAVCADMIYRRVWADYRGRIDLAVVAAAWPDFACRETGRKHWLLGGLGPLSGEIPGKVASDLGIPVVFANQCGPTRTTIPLLGIRLSEKIADRFAGRSSVSDGRHGSPIVAGSEEELVVATVTIHQIRGSQPCRSMSPSVPSAASSFASGPVGSPCSVPSPTGLAAGAG